MSSQFCYDCIRVKYGEVRATVTVKNGTSLNPMCDLHAADHLFRLIFDNSQVSFRTYYNHPLPTLIEVFDIHPS